MDVKLGIHNHSFIKLVEHMLPDESPRPPRFLRDLELVVDSVALSILYCHIIRPTTIKSSPIPTPINSSVTSSHSSDSCQTSLVGLTCSSSGTVALLVPYRESQSWGRLHEQRLACPPS